MSDIDRKIVFIGGDERNRHIYNSVKSIYKNTQIVAIDENEYNSKTVKNADIIILPTISSKDGQTLFTPLYKSKISIDDIAEDLKHCKAIIGGKIDKKIGSIAKDEEIVIYEYINDESFKALNAIPTAEGAIAIAVSNTEKTLWGAKCLVAGYGNIGKYLCYILTSFGADVTATARKKKDFDEMARKSVKSVNTSEVNEIISDFDIIFNTVPYRILNDDALKGLNEEVLVIDLASFPYGLDHSKTEQFKCKTILATSLPGKYSPKTAANIALSVILKILSEVLKNE